MASLVKSLNPKAAKNKKEYLSAKRCNRLAADAQKTIATRQLSCVSANRRTSRRLMHSTMASGKAISSALGVEKRQKDKEAEDKMVEELVEHLKRIAPFNKRWQVIETINQGTYGVVFSVQDVVTKVFGVIKVAKSLANDSGNASAEWEGFILETMFKRSEIASVVRLLDKGMLADQNGEGMEFVVLEKAGVPVKDYIFDSLGPLRKLRAAKVSLQMLKGIYDLHQQGLLHRDLKPDNMGLCSEEQPVTLLFDLGMSRMYTDGESDIRPPRTCCPFRGTPEWASGHAQKGREQTRFDDLIAWLYVSCELFASEKDPTQPLPWTYRTNNRAHKYLKSVFCPARYLLQKLPPQYYSINTYLMTANTLKVPDYRFLADRVYEVVKKYEEEVAKIPEDKLKELIVPPEDNNTKHVAPTKVTDAAQAKNEAEAKNVEQPPLPPPPAAGAPPV